MQDGKYDRLLRLLYDDIEKYETEVTHLTKSPANHVVCDPQFAYRR